MQEQSNILQKIIAQKQKVIVKRKALVSLEFLQEKATSHQFPVVRLFRDALLKKIAQQQYAIIAELKKASPSQGIIREDFNPKILAQDLEKKGAACLSVLTETDFFLGDDSHLQAAKEVCHLPVLRKDFIIDRYQIYESRNIGADCILLIASVLDYPILKQFYELALDLELEVLIEVHNQKELEKVLPLSPKIIGINNRDLKTFKVDIENTIKLAQFIPSSCIVVCESGIHKREDLELMASHGIYTFLIGELLMRASNPGAKLVELIKFAEKE